LKLKGKMLAGASALAMASGLIGVAAPAAHAVVTNPGACGGAISLVKLTSPTKGVGLTDQTQAGIKAVGVLAKDVTTKTVIGGTCTGHVRPGDTHNPGHADTDPAINLTPKAQATALLGNATCAQGPDAVNDTANAAANAYPLTGKITWTFNQTYFDPVANATKPYKMQAAVSLIGIAVNGDAADVVSLGGIVLSGVNAGATLATFATAGANHTSIWEDPVSKTGGTSGYNTGYEFDALAGIGCQDGTPNTANLTQVLAGGGPGVPSLINSNANGLIFEFGQA